MSNGKLGDQTRLLFREKFDFQYQEKSITIPDLNALEYQEYDAMLKNPILPIEPSSSSAKLLIEAFLIGNKLVITD